MASHGLENAQKELQRRRKAAGIFPRRPTEPKLSRKESLSRLWGNAPTKPQPPGPTPTPKPTPAEINRRLAAVPLPDRQRHEDPTFAAPPEPPGELPDIYAPKPPETPKKPRKRTKPIPRSIRAYPSLLGALYAAELAPAGKLYMNMRLIDRSGQGWVDRGELAQWVTKKRKLYGLRNLQIILRQGDGITWDINRGRIYYRAPNRIMTALGAGKLTGLPVMFPTKALLGGQQSYNAAAYKSWHAGRRESNPITRKAIRKVTGVPESTQRVYDDAAGVKRHKNIAILGEKTKQDYRAAVAERGRCVFTFKDWIGRMGEKDAEYIALNLPNSYETNFKQTAKGRLKKINGRIDLVNKPAQGNGDDVYRLYYQDGGAAGKAYNQDPSHDHYFKQQGTLVRTASKKPKLAGVGLWAMLPGQS